jgi:hypothetical protein
MGSHPWSVVTTYDADVAAALARPQDETFARGQFGSTYRLKELYASLGEPPPDLPPEPQVHSIAAARELHAESGTSVLDDRGACEHEFGGDRAAGGSAAS